jgi:hypothetical protein
MSGKFGRKQSEETKNKIRLSKIGKPRSEETKEKLRIFRKNKNFDELYGIEKSIEIRKKLSKKLQGNTHTKGKKLEEIIGLERAKERIKKLKNLKKEKNPFYGKKHTQETRNKMKESWSPQRRAYYSNRLKNGDAAYLLSFIKNPSKPQVQLYKMILELCPYAILNYPCLNFSIDITIPFLNLAFEFDGVYWHKDKEYDRSRQILLENEGWLFYRFEEIPSIKILKNILKEYHD